MNMSFNQMLQRSQQEQRQQEAPVEAPGHPSQAIEKVDVLLRDEKEYIGILRSYDQFANLVLTECTERIAARNPAASTDSPAPKWFICDVKLPGLMTIRGENVTICATVDLDGEDEPKGVKFAPEEQVRELANAQRNEKKASEVRKAKAYKMAGIEAGFGMTA
ncbi:hypothetical protein SLS60_004128 [Paraconiothyrium brasiliense]|uniref:Sm domain-containing protein n=1 Tax=Paraconiothyrium brasiliense TaxID=300254 RepID=A0ABR3RQN6_9PLEO